MIRLRRRRKRYSTASPAIYPRVFSFRIPYQAISERFIVTLHGHLMQGDGEEITLVVRRVQLLPADPEVMPGISQDVPFGYEPTIPVPFVLANFYYPEDGDAKAATEKRA